MGRQSDAPFKFLVRPVTTANIASKRLSWAFEDELFSLFDGVPILLINLRDSDSPWHHRPLNSRSAAARLHTSSQGRQFGIRGQQHGFRRVATLL